MDNDKTPDSNGTQDSNQPTPQSLNQIAEQPATQQQPFQPSPQPSQPPQFSQPTQQPTQSVQNQPYTETIVNTSNNNQNPKKKTAIIIGCSVGGLAILVLIAVLVIVLIKSGEKTVSCVTNSTSMGISLRTETNVRVRDGEISGGDMTIDVDLRSMRDSYKDYEAEIVDKMTEEVKDKCYDHCTFDRKYIEGDNIKYTLQYDKDGVDQIITSYGTEKMSAQEIADKVQETLEDYETTCRQR